MQITIFGCGYVGLVTGACLAEVGHDVLCVDIDPNKVATLQAGGCPIYEPGLTDLLQHNITAGRLRFSTDTAAGVHHGRFQFVAVDTLPAADGSADLSSVRSVVTTIGKHLDHDATIVVKSTVPVGTNALLREQLEAELDHRQADLQVEIASNPEFLKEGDAISDFLHPDRIIIGTDSEPTARQLCVLYAPFDATGDRILVMDPLSAELTKYAANAMLATRISFINELANIAGRLGADIEQVRRGIGSDPRIGRNHIAPGVGYGGSCFPKDVQALTRAAAAAGYPARLLEAVEAVNREQKQQLFQKISHHFGGRLQGRCIALWGLAFKPNTDDMREAPSRTLMEALWQAGATVRAFDPAARTEAKRLYGERDDLTLCTSPEEALVGADALAIVTEWDQFLDISPDVIRSALQQPVLFDGRNMLNPQDFVAAGFTYYGIGRGASCRTTAGNGND